MIMCKQSEVKLRNVLFCTKMFHFVSKCIVDTLLWLIHSEGGEIKKTA